MAAVLSQLGPPTFVVGAERSGTTLLRLMLDSHPELAFRYEFELAVEAMPDDERFPELNDYYEFLSNLRWVDAPPRIDRTLDYPGLVRSFLEQKRVADGKRRVGAVVHKHFVRLPRIWPDARYVHLVRDGRDVAQSCVAMGWYGNSYCAADRWLEAEREWDRLAAKVPSARRIEVRFEDLVSDPQAVLTRVCKLIGIAYHPEMLNYPSRTTYKAPTPQLAYQWPRKLMPREIQLLESRIGELLVDRGYALSGLQTVAPGPLGRTRLMLGNRAGVMRARMESLGPRLWLEYLVASRIGPRSWRSAALARVYGRMNAQLQ